MPTSAKLTPGDNAKLKSTFRDWEFLSSVLDAAGCLVVVLDRAGRVVLFNSACEALTGYPCEEVRNEPVWKRLLTPDHIGVMKALFNDLESNLPDEHEITWLSKTGEAHIIRWRNKGLVAKEGEVEYVVATGVDITDARRVREDLEESEARLQAILETAVEGIITIDAQGIVQSLNPAAERIFGYQANELRGRPVTLLMPPPYRDEHDDYIRSYLRSGEAKIIGIGREVEGLRRDGTVFPMELGVSEVKLPGRHLFTGIVRDISDRRKAEEDARLRLNELAHAARLLELGEMTSGIAHEVNQPLAAIVSFAEACQRMLKAGTDEPEVLRDALAQIATQGERAGNIIHSLRKLARKGDAELEWVDINRTVRDVLELIAHEVRRSRIRVKLDLDEHVGRVTADRTQIEQVLLNLTRNAVEAMQECGENHRELAIETTRRESGELEVVVTDTGKGLPEDGLDRVFETFFSTKPSGMGVGLSISRSILEAHGGRLWAESNPRGGAVFHFTLPPDPTAST